MRIDLICVGKLKEDYWRAACAEYGKRLGRYVKLQVVEVPDLPIPDRASPAQQDAIRRQEGARMLERLPQGARAVALDGGGEPLSSEQLAARIGDWQMDGRTVALLIGGSLGLHADILARCDMRISMGRMTFPHQLARVMALEQLYRGYRILRGERYHK